MSDLSDLITAIAVLVTASSSAFVLVFNTVRSGGKPEKAAKSAAEETARKVLDAVADGELSPEEIAEINRTIREEGES